MTIKIPNPENEAEEIEVYTAAEVAEREGTVRTTVEGEWKPKYEEVTGKLTAAEQAAAVRAGEFSQFRRLSEEQVKQLSEKDATIYNNQKVIAEGIEREAAAKKAATETLVNTAIKAKAGNDAKLADRMKELWPLIGIEANTPEEIENKTKMVLGAISTTQPDLVASVQGFSGGMFEPPKPAGQKDGESFADTERGKQGAAELGLILEKPKS